MASEDVIELGSSDDETEPAPKKSKPMPNAMVCIPRKLHEVTIKPAKLNLPNKGLGKRVPTSKVGLMSKVVPTAKVGPLSKVAPVSKVALVSKGTTVTRSPNILTNPYAGKSRSNGKPVQKPAVKSHLKLTKPITIQNASNSNILLSKIPNLSNVSNVLKKPIKIQNTKSLSNLPPSITVKRTTQSCNKPIIFMNTANQQGLLVRSKKNATQENEVHTVELDDDEGTSQTSSPAWYLRPEEETVAPTLEQENNKEPELPKMIEITIEDSPIKPATNKRTYEIGAELAITIEDSPIKTTADNVASLSESDNETSSCKEPNSKKKLKYPKEADNQNKKTLEIEIDIPHEVTVVKDSVIKDKTTTLKEISIVPVKKPPETNKRTNIIPIETKDNKIEVPNCSTESEFHSVYQSFIDVCFQLENSDDMKKIVEKKIQAYYRQVPKEYTDSEEFIDMVASKIVAMKASPEKMYLYIKDIVDELNMQRKVAKSQIVNKETKTEEPEQFTYGEDNEFDSKRQRQIRKLEKTIKKLHRAIQKLEEQEVDFDDEDDSVYLLTERYKERMVRVYAKFCQLTNTKMPSEPRVLLDARPGQPSGPAKRLEKWINKKVPIGTPLPFPDFHDVLRCVRDANDDDKLGWNEADIMEEARDLFTRCGKKLQRRRQENEWRLAASRIAFEVDPAENNEQLKCKLEENKKVAANKETEIFNKYADRQNLLKLEAVEIGDKEAEESPVESEEEEANDESVSLENKDKRKDRLKRLLHERSKKVSEGKENQTSKELKSESDTKIPGTNDEPVTTKESEKTEGSDKNLEDPHDKDKSHTTTETLSVSDDSNDLESDIDELHLLQKLHSGNEAHTSTLESSDSESPIAISDSLESGSDTKKQLSDVISIENSSYSESEIDKIDNIPFKKTDSVELVSDSQPNNESETVVHAGMETESSNAVVETDGSNAVVETDGSNVVMDKKCLDSATEKGNGKFNNQEYSESVENILLASSDDEAGGSQEEDTPPSTDIACINLKDDLISIDETVIGSVVVEPDKEVEKEPNAIMPGTEKDADNPGAIEINVNNVDLKNDNKVNDTSNNIEAMDTSQNEVLSSSKKESAEDNACVIIDDTKLADTVSNMDVDQDEIVKELETKSSVEENEPLTLSSETQ